MSKIIIPARLSYANIWDPRSINGGPEKYSASLLIDKTDKKTITTIETAIDTAIEAGIGKFGGKRPANGTLKLPLRDGDVERDDDAYAGMLFLNANSATAPQIVNQRVQAILDRDEVYSGCYVNVSLDFYAFNTNGNRGVAAGLGNIQKVRDGERLDGRISAEKEFAVVSFSDDDTSYLD